MLTPGAWHRSSHSGGGDGNNCVDVSLEVTPTSWTKSSYSGGGEGNDCVEVAHSHPHIRIRDSKTPAGAILTIPAPAFSTFVDALKDGRLAREP